MAVISLLIEEEVDVTLIIEVAEVVEDLMDHFNSLLSISFNEHNLILMELSQKGQFVRFVERLVIWPLIVNIGLVMLIKESIHLPSLQL